VTLILPENLPVNSQYFEVLGDPSDLPNHQWNEVLPAVGGGDGFVDVIPGDRIIVLRVTDGGVFDEDGVHNGEIDPKGGPKSNNAPVAGDDDDTTPELSSPTVLQTGTDNPLNINTSELLANDSDPEGDPLSIVFVSAGANTQSVTLSDSTITFTPAAGFSGAAQFSYVLSDASKTDTGLVTVTVGEGAEVSDADGGAGV